MDNFHYRKTEQPTGEEVNAIVKFNREIMINRIQREGDLLRKKIKRVLKITATLIMVSEAVTLIAILVVMYYLK